MILIGHAGHPEVEGTMGQWDQERGTGRIYLVENIDDVATLHVAQPHHLAYTTQTTLSVDDTRNIIDALRQRFPTIQGPKTMTSATPPRTAKMQFANSRANAT